MARIDPVVRAAAIADLHDGEQPAIVAERYNLNRETVKSWRLRYAPIVAPSAAPVAPAVAAPWRRPLVEAQQLALQDLIEQSLRAKITATWKIAEHATIPEWLEKQNAADVATLFEVIDRSAVGILDRMAARHAASASAEDDAGDGSAERPAGVG